jgi:hypothetical protein
LIKKDYGYHDCGYCCLHGGFKLEFFEHIAMLMGLLKQCDSYLEAKPVIAANLGAKVVMEMLEWRNRPSNRNKTKSRRQK